MKKIIISLGLAIAFSAVLILASCGSSKYENEITSIDSLMLINDSTAALLEQIDTTGILKSRGQFAENWKVIKANIDAIQNPDVIRDTVYWPYITFYEGQDRRIKKLFKKLRVANKEYDLNEKQLTDLKFSLKKELIPQDSVSIYMMDEELAVTKLNLAVKSLVNTLIEVHHSLDSLHQHADEAIQHYSAINKTK